MKGMALSRTKVTPLKSRSWEHHFISSVFQIGIK
ncbi:unnamed protein product [Brassica oleracea]